MRRRPARARSPIAKRIWIPVNARNFGLVMTSLLSVRNPAMLMRPYLFGGKLHGEIRLRRKNKKYNVSLYVVVGYVDKRGKKRKREGKKTEKRRRLSKVQRERERRIARAGRPEK